MMVVKEMAVSARRGEGCGDGRRRRFRGLPAQVWKKDGDLRPPECVEGWFAASGHQGKTSPAPKRGETCAKHRRHQRQT